MVEQRRHPRKIVQVELLCRDEPGLGPLSFTGVNLSAGGAFLRSDLLLEAGEVLELELVAPGRSVMARAEVVWARRFPNGDQPAGMGVRFAALAHEDQRALEALLG